MVRKKQRTDAEIVAGGVCERCGEDGELISPTGVMLCNLCLCNELAEAEFEDTPAESEED